MLNGGLPDIRLPASDDTGGKDIEGGGGGGGPPTDWLGDILGEAISRKYNSEIV